MSEHERPFDPQEMDLSKLTVQQLIELREAIMARVQSELGGPGAPGPIFAMATTDDEFWNPWDLVARYLDQFILVIDAAFRRVALGILTVGSALASANFYASEANTTLGIVLLAASGVFGLWFVGDAVLGRGTKTLD